MKASGIKKLLTISLLSVSMAAAFAVPSQAAGGRKNQMFGRQGGMGQQVTSVTQAEAPGEIVTDDTENAAAALTADPENAIRIQMSDSDNSVKITRPGTYIISGACSDGSITVKKGVTDVVLILENLSLSSSDGAPVSINKSAQAQLIVSGSVTLTDNEDPADETSSDSAAAEAYDGAALKIKSGAQVYLTGDGDLTLNGNAKNGVKVSGTDAHLLMDGEALTVTITAANDGINSSSNVMLRSGTLTVTAKDDAIHADGILTIGVQDSETGPAVTASGMECLEAAVVNIFSGSVQVTASDDAINGILNELSLAPSINITGGTVSVQSQGDGLDCNGNINILGGVLNISSASFGGEAGIDYDGSLYIAETAVINNTSGIAGPDNMQGGMGGWNFGGHGGWMNQRPGNQPQTPDGNTSATPPDFPGGQPGSFDPSFQPGPGMPQPPEQQNSNDQ